MHLVIGEAERIAQLARMKIDNKSLAMLLFLISTTSMFNYKRASCLNKYALGASAIHVSHIMREKNKHNISELQKYAH
jgi:hypothetical protein